MVSHIAHSFNGLNLTNTVVLLMMPLIPQDGNTATSGVIGPKSYVTLDFNWLPVIVPVASHDKKSHIAPHLIVLTNEMQ